MPNEIPIEGTTNVPNEVPTFTKGKPSSLSVYEWHQLLGILEREMQVCNIDRRMAVHLWERISTQLHGEECIVTGSEKDRRLHPQNFIKKEEPKPQEKVPIKEEKSLWETVFGNKSH